MHSCHKHKRTWPLRILTATPDKQGEGKRAEMKAPCSGGEDCHSRAWILLLRGHKMFLENGWDARAETGNTGQGLERIMEFSFNVVQEKLMKLWPHIRREEGGGGRLNESHITQRSLNMRIINLNSSIFFISKIHHHSHSFLAFFISSPNPHSFLKASVSLPRPPLLLRRPGTFAKDFLLLLLAFTWCSSITHFPVLSYPSRQDSAGISWVPSAPWTLRCNLTISHHSSSQGSHCPSEWPLVRVNHLAPTATKELDFWFTANYSSLLQSLLWKHPEPTLMVHPIP